MCGHVVVAAVLLLSFFFFFSTSMIDLVSAFKQLSEVENKAVFQYGGALCRAAHAQCLDRMPYSSISS